MKELPHAPSPWILRGSLLVGGVVLVGIGWVLFTRPSSAPPPSPAPQDSVSVAPKIPAPAVPAPATSTAPAKPVASAERMSTRSPDAIAWLERLGAQNSTQAISWALTESDPDRRAELVQAALRGWASVDCDAAANWALHQSYAEHGQAMSAVFNGANKTPEKALQLADRLSREDPARTGDYRSYLIFSLGSVGEFSRAADYAAASPPEQQTQLLTSAFNRWARQEPEVAARAALRLPDASMQRAAFQAALGGWAQSNPETLTKAALDFPEGDDRKLGLITGLRSWIEKNPEAAGEWISQHKYMPEMEAALED